MMMLLNENGRLMNDKLKVAETLNSQLCGQPPQALGNPKDQANDIALVDPIINKTIQVLIRLEKNALILRYIVFLNCKIKCVRF